MRATPVPITPTVLTWAINQSGYKPEEVAARVRVPGETLDAWCSGSEQPNLTHFKALGAALRRPPSTLLLPRPPRATRPPVQFRHAPGTTARRLNPTESRRLREAARLQRSLAWILAELHQEGVGLPEMTIQSSAEEAASEVRHLLGISVAEQESWQSEWEAFRAWRSALHRAGIAVFSFPLGERSVRGFSLWDPMAPVIAVNTHWRTLARIFTLFHETGHLVTRTDSLCVEGGFSSRGSLDSVERWCEQFAAALLLPWEAVERYLTDRCGWNGTSRIDNLATVGRVARRFQVSLRAATLRLIKRQVAAWKLYAEIPPASEKKPKGGGGTGRRRPDIRLDEYGEHTARVFLTALKKEVLDRTDARDLLCVSDSDLDTLQSRTVMG